MNSATARAVVDAAPAGAVRRCVPGDEDALAAIGSATFLETFAGVLDGAAVLRHCRSAHAPSVYRAWLDDAEAALWLASVAPGDAPVGYATLVPSRLPVAVRREDDLEIKRIYLLQRFQGAGLGRRLLNAAIDAARAKGCRSLLLGVYVGNTSAQGFYRRMGFASTGDHRLFRVGDHDYEDVIMALDLRAPGGVS